MSLLISQAYRAEPENTIREAVEINPAFPFRPQLCLPDIYRGERSTCECLAQRLWLLPLCELALEIAHIVYDSLPFLELCAAGYRFSHFSFVDNYQERPGIRE